jgi:CelD/BcsL family acetyltransferase involved in cellulose biosynthesis
VTVRVIPVDDVDDALIEGWRQLGREAAEPNPFAGPDLVLSANRWLGTGDKVALVVVERGAVPRFVMPVVRSRHFRRIPVPVLTTWSHPYCYLGTPLLSTSDAEDVWAEALIGMRKLAPWAVLRQVGTDGVVARGYARAQQRRRRAATGLELPARPILHRRADGGYLQLLSGSRRSKLRRLRPRLAAEAGGEVEVLDRGQPGVDLEGAIDGFLAMEAESWKGADGGAMACRPGHSEFFRDACRRSAEHGALQMRVLRAGGTTIAYQVNLVAASVLFGFKTTFDAAFHRASPGVVLWLDTVQKFHADGLTTYDSCLGANPTPFHDLFPDRRPMADAVLSMRGVVGEAATRLVPRAGAAYREAKRVQVSIRARSQLRRGAHESGATTDAAG